MGRWIKKPHWDRHPGVRSGSDLTVGERAADRLKAGFGSWGFLLGMVGMIAVWIVLNKTGAMQFDSRDLLTLNLTLSVMAGLQGGALQIASNRGDRVSSELAVSTHATSQELLKLNKRQMEILERLNSIDDRLDELGSSEETTT